MVSVKTSFIQTGPRTRPPAYHTIISKWLQKQFVHACVWVLITAYVLSHILSQSNGLWQWMPWSRTTIRAVLLFFSVFPLLLQRKVNLHVVEAHRSYSLISPSSVQRFLSPANVTVPSCYALALVTITSFYVSNASSSRAISFLITDRSFELARLNERWIYLYYLTFVNNVILALRHFLVDADRLRTSSIKLPVQVRLKQGLPNILVESFSLAAITPIIAPIVYLFIRHKLYEVVASIAKLVSQLSHSNHASFWPVSLGLLLTSFSLSFLQFAFILLTNFFFDIYLTQGPMKKGKLGCEKSLYPEETLLTGLNQHNKELTQLLAFEELEIISINSKERRVRIFETGTNEAVIWLGIMQACLTQIESTCKELSALAATGKPSMPPREAAQPAPRPPAVGASPIHLQSGNIFKSSPHRPVLSEKLKSGPTSSTIPVLPPQSLALYENIRKRATEYAPVLQNFLAENRTILSRRRTRQAFRRYKFVVLAISSLSNLIVRSAQEDTYGRVHKDVIVVLDQFTLLANQCAQHVGSPESSDNLAEPLALKRQLETALVDIGSIFAPYMSFSSKPALQAKLRSLEVKMAT